MEHFPNRLTGSSKLPPGTFFFVYDYWTYDEGEDAFKSFTDGSVMPDELRTRLIED